MLSIDRPSFSAAASMARSSVAACCVTAIGGRPSSGASHAPLVVAAAFAAVLIAEVKDVSRTWGDVTGCGSSVNSSAYLGDNARRWCTNPARQKAKTGFVQSSREGALDDQLIGMKSKVHPAYKANWLPMSAPCCGAAT
jgi:hypothetical protein